MMYHYIVTTLSKKEEKTVGKKFFVMLVYACRMTKHNMLYEVTKMKHNTRLITVVNDEGTVINLTYTLYKDISKCSGEDCFSLYICEEESERKSEIYLEDIAETEEKGLTLLELFSKESVTVDSAEYIIGELLPL